jgi:hypothetical protein
MIRGPGKKASSKRGVRHKLALAYAALEQQPATRTAEFEKG